MFFPPKAVLALWGSHLCLGVSDDALRVSCSGWDPAEIPAGIPGLETNENRWKTYVCAQKASQKENPCFYAKPVFVGRMFAKPKENRFYLQKA